MPELISSSGYVSGLFGKWHLGPTAPGAILDDAPREQGFETHKGVIEGTLTQLVGGGVSGYDNWDKYEDGVQMGIRPQR